MLSKLHKSSVKSKIAYWVLQLNSKVILYHSSEGGGEQRCRLDRLVRRLQRRWLDRWTQKQFFVLNRNLTLTKTEIEIKLNWTKVGLSEHIGKYCILTLQLWLGFNAGRETHLFHIGWVIQHFHLVNQDDASVKKGWNRNMTPKEAGWHTTKYLQP